MGEEKNCDTCKHEHKDLSDPPCSECRGDIGVYWEPKEPRFQMADDESATDQFVDDADEKEPMISCATCADDRNSCPQSRCRGGEGEDFKYWRRKDMTMDNGMDIPEYQATEDKVIEWALERGIFEKSNPFAQFLKVTEELGEVAETLAKNKPLEEFELEMGDLYVTMILLARLKGTDTRDCLDRAYRKISGRKGSMVNGVFIRDCG